MSTIPLKVLVDEWLRLDRNEVTRQEIQALYTSGDVKELERRLRTRIEFGTAGLRGKMEAGWSRMNDLIVIQASQGLCAYVLAHVSQAEDRGVVIGHDHRHNSERWALLAAAAFLNQGVKVHLLQGIVLTPLVPFSIKKLGAACGIMITASHNPKYDNGYKVYWENAVQIIGPHDKGITKFIEHNLEPLTWNTDTVIMSPRCTNSTQDLVNGYLDNIIGLVAPKGLTTQNLTFVNTSLHGVSDDFLSQAFSLAGYLPYIPVKEQQQPDPEFPTVSFPNPEEQGALDLAISTADIHQAHYVLAQDPDSDRFVAAQKEPDGHWHIFTGDQLGIIFAGQIIDNLKSKGEALTSVAMVASTVSSKMIAAMARLEGFRFEECLTGFKYIGNTAIKLENEGFSVPFGYEEAIGYMFGSNIRDKDGIAATIKFTELANLLEAGGSSVLSYLNDLYSRYGYFQVSFFGSLPISLIFILLQTSNGYFICNDQKIITKIFTRLQNFCPDLMPSYPSRIAGLEITQVVDLGVGYDSLNPPTFQPSLPTTSGYMIQFKAKNKSQDLHITLTIRTSGTEPKIKYYLEGDGPNSGLVSCLLPAVVAELGSKWLEAEENGLIAG
ncbi:hypothetical protein BDN72DRAFT_957272 [Pluteus cervinus]|uniref:Uncharacterized protein n=1 Tax=Pluteus cervinus TaxID=181527 RepID=A0ACD3B3N5_9AGAR|nr:hypothetical protein BDN72DRAFT_957272 [Pluteus cervinus]